MTQGERWKRWWFSLSAEVRKDRIAKMCKASADASRRRGPRYCIVAGCEEPSHCRELCVGHYQQLRRKGRVYRMELGPYRERRRS